MTQDVTSSKRSTSAAPKSKREAVKPSRGSRVGVISARWGVFWVVSSHRKDKRTGAQQAGKWGDYAQELLEGVTLGSVDWSQAPQQVTVVEEVKPPEVPIALEYMLLYEERRVGGHATGSRMERVVKYEFPAEDDVEAIQVARAYMQLKAIPYLAQKEAGLFCGDREVYRL